MTRYTILTEDGTPLAHVEGDKVATQAIIVVTPPEGQTWPQHTTAHIAAAFKAYGVHAVVLSAPVRVQQVFLPEE